jgi:hypothetical protein
MDERRFLAPPRTPRLGLQHRSDGRCCLWSRPGGRFRIQESTAAWLLHPVLSSALRLLVQMVAYRCPHMKVSLVTVICDRE